MWSSCLAHGLSSCPGPGPVPGLVSKPGSFSQQQVVFSSFRIPDSQTPELKCEEQGHLVTVPFTGRRGGLEQRGASRPARTVRALQ